MSRTVEKRPSHFKTDPADDTGPGPLKFRYYGFYSDDGAAICGLDVSYIPATSGCSAWRGATVAHATLRNNTCNPQIAAHTSIWLVEAELRQTPVAKILEEAHRTGVGVSGPDLRAEALRLLNKNDLEPSILFVTGPSAEREAAESSRKQVHDLAWTDDGTGDAIRQLQSHSPG